MPFQIFFPTRNGKKNIYKMENRDFNNEKKNLKPKTIKKYLKKKTKININMLIKTED